MGKFQDLTGQKFGKLTAIKRTENKDKKVMWLCKCDCGNETIVWSSDLICGKKRSCGCLLEEWRNKKRDELIGEKFGRIKVLKWIPISERENKRKCYLCQCDCGNIFPCRKDLLKEGRRVSCGCYNREISKAGITKKHGKYQSRLYSIWHKIKERCLNPNVKEYKNYGGRGITICDEWLRDFQVFYDWSMSHGYEDNLSIDRIDVNGNYEPDNCRWITNLKQQNNRRDNIFLDCNGEKLTVAELSRKYDIPYPTMIDWVKRQKLTFNQILEKISAR